MPGTPLDTLEAVLNTARTRLLDAIESLGGDILTDTNVFTQTVTNAAWRRWQELLVKHGYSGLKGQILFSNLPASTQSDSSVPCYFNYDGFFDGTTLHTSFPLPQDMLAPDTKPGSIGERINGDVIMTDLGGPELEGLPVVPLAPWNRIWEWRQDTLYIPGTTNNFDFRIRYFAYYADFVFPVSSQTVPIIRSLNGFAWLIAAEMAKSRSDLDAADFEAKADMAAQVILGRDGIIVEQPEAQ